MKTQTTKTSPVRDENQLISNAQARRNIIRQRKTEMDLTAMQEKITKAAKWSDFRVRREKIIDDFIKVKRT